MGKEVGISCQYLFVLFLKPQDSILVLKTTVAAHTSALWRAMAPHAALAPCTLFCCRTSCLVEVSPSCALCHWTLSFWWGEVSIFRGCLWTERMWLDEMLLNTSVCSFLCLLPSQMSKCRAIMEEKFISWLLSKDLVSGEEKFTSWLLSKDLVREEWRFTICLLSKDFYSPLLLKATKLFNLFYILLLLLLFSTTLYALLFQITIGFDILTSVGPYLCHFILLCWPSQAHFMHVFTNCSPGGAAHPLHGNIATVAYPNCKSQKGSSPSPWQSSHCRLCCGVSPWVGLKWRRGTLVLESLCATAWICSAICWPSRRRVVQQ